LHNPEAVQQGRSGDLHRAPGPWRQSNTRDAAGIHALVAGASFPRRAKPLPRARSSRFRVHVSSSLSDRFSFLARSLTRERDAGDADDEGCAIEEEIEVGLGSDSDEDGIQIEAD